MTASPCLVTGAAGWLGSRLVELLGQAGVGPLRCFVRPGQAAVVRGYAPEAEIVEGDLADSGDCERFFSDARDGILYHCSGLIHPSRVCEYYEVNVRAAANALAAASRARVRRAVVVSSNSPLGCNPHPDHQFDEDSPYNPCGHYGRSKMLMELEAQKFHQRGQVESVIIRAPWFYGPNQPPRQSEFFRMIRAGKAPIVGDGKNFRSMAYIDNLCQGLRLAAQTKLAAGKIYWIADERPYAWNEIIDTVAALLRDEFGLPASGRRTRLPGFAGELALGADKLIQALGFYNQKIHVLSECNKTIVCSINRAKQELGYRPEVDLREGMRRSIAWCLQRGIEI